MRYAALCTVLFSAAAMALMLRYAATKTIVVAEEVTAGSGAEQEYAAMRKESIPLKLKEESVVAPAILIPLPDEVRPNDIIIENHYLEHRINVIIAGAETDYYKDTHIRGGIEKVEAAACYAQDDGIVLAFRMDALYEHRYLLEEHALLLDFVPPHEMYDRIVVLDAAHGGDDRGATGYGLAEKDVTLAITERVREQLSDSGIRVYCTRQQDTGPSIDERTAFINELRPDLVVSVHLDDTEDASRCGTSVWYNADYVIPGFGNVELADMLERNVVLAEDGRALGIFPCGGAAADVSGSAPAGSDTATGGLGSAPAGSGTVTGGSGSAPAGSGTVTGVSETAPAAAEADAAFLEPLRVPAAILKAGYLSSEREGALFMQEAYLDRIADGICDAIYEAYDTPGGAAQPQADNGKG